MDPFGVWETIIRCTYEADGVAMAFTKPCDGSKPKQVRMG